MVDGDENDEVGEGDAALGGRDEARVEGIAEDD